MHDFPYKVELREILLDILLSRKINSQASRVT